MKSSAKSSAKSSVVSWRNRPRMRGAGRPMVRRDEVVARCSGISNRILDPVRADINFDEWVDEEIAALKVWLSMNPLKRNYENLSKETGVPETTLKKWISRKRFFQIGKIFDARVATGPLDDGEIGIQEVLSRRIRLNKIVSKAIALFEAALDAGTIKIRVEDFVKIAKLQIEILGMHENIRPREDAMSDEELRYAIAEKEGNIGKNERIIIGRFADDESGSSFEALSCSEESGGSSDEEEDFAIYADRASA